MFDFIKNLFGKSSKESTWEDRIDAISINPTTPCFITTEPYLTYHKYMQSAHNKTNSIQQRRNDFLTALSLFPAVNQSHIKYDKEPYKVYSIDMYGFFFFIDIGQFHICKNMLDRFLELNCIDTDFYNRMIDHIKEYSYNAKITLQYISKNEGVLQRKLYDELLNTDADREVVKRFVRSTLLLKRERVKGTNKLFIDYDLLKDSDIKL